ncbi:Crp/Fnr family transcriptional regulator [Aquabacterium sp. OR-4]|uniref:Crp/Fnr family transcriptional regulator n=1 Tax=Aquabacterium sp. OR-4 TaxID=2978127 RepID=UPI0021B1F26C|nr:Crp/Fnr family transcriptional regulator [Aquabacterium sp. OR-4]MDT7838479.1 Crp/Fnr family transcriptional regulator [Aquabacterium sp. OR-4]
MTTPLATPLQQHLHTLLGELPAAPQAVAAAARPIQCAAGTPLLRAGEHWTCLYWVARGGLRLYYLDRQGQASNKNFFLDGALLWPLTPTLATQAVDFWIEAVEPTQLWAVPAAAWQQACTEAPGWPAWQALERRTLAALLDDKMRREQQFLQCTATQRYQALCAQRPEWLSRLPLRHLASYLGITDVALSRIRRRLNPG